VRANLFSSSRRFLLRKKSYHANEKIFKGECKEMKKMMVIISAALMATALASNQALAEEKQGSIGIGTYSVVLDINGSTGTYVGSALVGSYSFTPFISAGAHFYSTTLDLGTEEIGGFDAMVRFGSQGQGFTYFGGVGVFSETVTDFGFSLDASGTTVGYGIGYNWDSVALTWEGSIRSTGDYEDFTGQAVTQATGSLNVGYRF